MTTRPNNRDEKRSFRREFVTVIMTSLSYHTHTAMEQPRALRRDVGDPARIAYPYQMPPLGNQRHEGFCRAVSRGEALSTAYSAVYHVGTHVAEVNGSRLLRNAKVAERVAELKGQAAKRTEKTVASLVADLDEAFDLAKQCNNPAAMVAAIMAQARLLGLEAPRQFEVLHKPAPLPTRVLELTEQEWTAQFASGLRPRPALTGVASGGRRGSG